MGHGAHSLVTRAFPFSAYSTDCLVGEFSEVRTALVPYGTSLSRAVGDGLQGAADHGAPQ
jgi:hypothetical protein